MDEKTIQRIKKLQALAERGVGGEKTTAQKKLAKLLKDNGINSLDELQKEEYEYTIFSYNGKNEIKLLRQCMYKVMGAKSDRTAYKPYGRRQKIGIYCTKAQKIEIELNPPLELDKRKQRRLARKMARQINKTLPTAAETLTAALNCWVQSIKPALATLCENVAAVFSNMAAGLREESEAVEND